VVVKAWLIIILLYLGGLIGIVEWFDRFEEYYSFNWNSSTAPAVAVSVRLQPDAQILVNGETHYRYPIRYKTASGQDVIVSPYLTRTVIENLAAGVAVNLLYIQGNPHRTMLQRDLPKLSMGFGALFLGFACIAMGIVAMDTRDKWSRFTKYLHGSGGVGDAT
jgi:hypothetical protein